jgi:hypothetical protein
MNPILASVTTLAVSMIYLVWQNYHAILQRRERVLRSRVAWMLWQAANTDG